ncbi:MAG: TonB-dependent receptor [Myxococcales bacterium]|nr:TonB-dependent receptor [Myxococcales bacterium]
MQAPVLERAVPAVAPPGAEHLQAKVGLVLTIGADGSVSDVRVVAPAGHGLDEAAVAAARQFRFSPATRDGQPVAARVRYDLAFAPPPPAQGRLQGRVLLARGAGGVVGAGGAGGAEITISQEPSGLALAHLIADGDGAFQAPALAPGRYRVRVLVAGELVADAVEEVRADEATVVTYRQASLVVRDTDTFGATARVSGREREVTRRSVTRDELLGAAGTRGDPLRVIELLPGVARPAAGEGTILIRGSSPEDSQFFVDGAYVLRLYHFGGLTSFAPAQLIDRLDLFPGNFSVRYGRAIGGAVEVKLRDPDFERTRGVVEVNLLDAGALVETPLGERWAVAAGVRRSTIDLWFASVAGDDSAQVTAAPVYLDYQLLAALRRQGPDRLRLQLYGSVDEIGALIEPLDTDPSIRGNIRQATDFHRAQAVWSRRYSDTLQHEVTAMLGTFGFRGEIGPSIRQDLRVLDAALRGDLRWRARPWLSLMAGTDVMLQRGDVSLVGPRAQQLEGRPGAEPLESQPMIELDQQLTYLRPAAYVEAVASPLARAELTVGARVDHFGDIDQTVVDLRSSARLRVGQGTVMKIAVGQFSQPPDYGEAFEDLGNPALGAERAVHVSAGVEQELGARASLGLEAYAKRLDRLIVDDAQGMLANAGRGRIVGLEVAGRLVPGGRMSGFLSYSLSRSERRDASGPWRLFDSDQTHVLAAAAQWRLGRGFLAGATVRLVSGPLETPVRGSVYDANLDRYQPVYGAVNSERGPLFSQLDLRVEKGWRLAHGRRLAAYLDLQNATNTKNRETTVWSYDYRTRGAVYGLPLLPSLGLRGEL